MKIAVVVCSYPPYRGGIGNAAARQSAALRDAGHEILVLCPAHEGQARHGMVEGIEVRYLPALLRHGVSAFIPSVAKNLRGVDALYLHYPFYGGAEAAAIAALVMRIPYVAYFHMDVRARGVRGAIIDVYDRTLAVAILREAKKVFVSSIDYARNASIGRLNLPTLQELPYGIDTDLFHPGEPDPEVLKDLGLDTSRPIVLFVGGMDFGHAFKGVSVLIEAMAGVPPDEAQLVLVGDGELRQGFQRLAHAQCAAPVTFVGSASDSVLRELYRAATVSVLPSISGEEAFGIVLIESMASGTPVVASNLPGVRTVIDEGTGVLVPAGDVNRLREAICSFVRNHERTAVMSAAARTKALERFSRLRERDDLVAVFAELSKKK